MTHQFRNLARIVFVVAVLLAAPIVSAQTGRLSGKVLDLEGKPLAGVKVTITNENTGQNYSTTTDSSGSYTQADLIPGTYSVKFESPQGQGDTQEVKIEAGETTLDEDFRTAAARQGGASTGDAGKQRTMANSSAQMKGHIKNGNDALHDAQEVRKQIPTAKPEEKAALEAKMKADFKTAVDEYQAALNILVNGDTNKVQAMGLIGVQRNGLVDQQKATQMLVQDKNVPILLTNLGLAYSGLEDYVEAISVLQQAAAIKAEPSTYMQLGTDLAAVGKVPEGMETCEKILSADPAATDLLNACYRNIAVLLINANKMADAVAPLQKATQLNPKDATAWKMLGDCLSGAISTKEANGKTTYVFPPGTLEAYRHYLELEPNGVYAAQVKATLDGFEQLQKAQ